MEDQQPLEDQTDSVNRRYEELYAWLDVPSPASEFIPFWSEDWQRPKPEEPQPSRPSAWGDQRNLTDDLDAFFNQAGGLGAHSTATDTTTSAAQSKPLPKQSRRPWNWHTRRQPPETSV
ncbi:hypothetical protein [Nonomuraea sp. NEAU-A123]|uniref:hypothetical protein n=1 Tax=Nonomuraea sp. NEAU-A123 TaxID=2839649 RepID=UPI001BE3F3EF|nr:hypothetical protein [Nonomuraea sp. NEAU-A123]MBT2234277.1 hypothetical protein [Nonomuraea sp. NEAU-A123]